tara:strand:+ start:477 stop:797 length:321 start_codon:yes stop_codon:yes gene_type:complete
MINNLRKYIRQIIKEEHTNFVSHSYEPKAGDHVINNNPKCKHYGSEGVVISIDDLPKDSGKTVSYQCTNSGPEWKEGDTLDKTMDQLAPMDDTVTIKDLISLFTEK